VALVVVAAFVAPLPAAVAATPFTTRADAVCREADAKFRKLPEPRSATLRAMARYLDRFLAIVRLAQARLEALRPPAAQRRAYAAYLATTRRQIALIAQMESAASRGERARYARLADEVDRLDDLGNAAARRLGLRVCAQSG
jgi:hypothetical protein